MPTFDFFNLVRRVVGAAIKAAFSPTGIVLGLTAGLTALATSFYSLFDFSWLSYNFTFPTDSSTLSQFVLYCIAYDRLVSILNPTWSFIVNLITFVGTFFASLVTAVCAVGVAKVCRRAIYDYMS